MSSKASSNGAWVTANIPPHWDALPLKRAVHINRVELPETTSPNFEIEYIDISSVTIHGVTTPPQRMTFRDSPSRARRIIRSGDTILSTVRTYLKAVAHFNQANGNLVASTGFAVLTPPDSLNSRFLYYAVQADGFISAVEAESKGVNYPAITPSELGNLPIPLPPRSEQDAIVGFLDRRLADIDRFIANKRRLIELLEEQRRAVTRRVILKGLEENETTCDTRIDWIGHIPSSWRLRRTKYLFRMIVDKAPENNGMELLSIYTDIGVKPRRELEERGNRATTTDGYLKVRKHDFIVNKLLAWMGAIGISEFEGVTSPAYDILRPITPMNVYYYHYLFRCGVCFAEFKRSSRGIMDMRNRLYFDAFGRIALPYPPLPVQNAIVARLESEFHEIDEAAERTQREISLMNEFRASLIAEAVTGKMTILGNA